MLPLASRTAARCPRALGGGELRAQRGILGDDVLVRGKFRHRTRDGRDLADGFGVLQVGVDRRDDNTRFDSDQVDPQQRHADPRVDDDALVEHAIEDVDETCAAWGAFNCHAVLLPPWGSTTYRRRRAPRGLTARAVVNASTRSCNCRISARKSACSPALSRAAPCESSRSYRHQSSPISWALSREQTNRRMRIVSSSTSASETLMSPAITSPLSSTRSRTSTNPVARWDPGSSRAMSCGLYPVDQRAGNSRARIVELAQLSLQDFTRRTHRQ